jgi:hypothetical protein
MSMQLKPQEQCIAISMDLAAAAAAVAGGAGGGGKAVSCSWEVVEVKGEQLHWSRRCLEGCWPAEDAQDHNIGGDMMTLLIGLQAASGVQRCAAYAVSLHLQSLQAAAYCQGALLCSENISMQQ